MNPNEPSRKEIDPGFQDAPTTLREKAVSSISWSALGRISQQVLSLMVVAVLSRLLVPGDFGLIAMLMVFIGFANVFADSGLGSALVQRKTINARHISTAFTLNVGIGVVLAGLLVVSAPLLARFYDAPSLEALARAFALSFILSSIGVVPMSLMRRELKFQPLAKIDIAAGVFSGALAISTALFGGGVWSLVVLSLSQQALRTALILLCNGQRITLGFHQKEARQLIGFSAGLLGFNSINYWQRNIDQLLIGRLLGASPLGLYSRAYQLMMLPLSQINSILSSVMFPMFSSIQHQPGRIANAYTRALGMVSLLAFPMALGLFLVADPLIPLVYGSEWSGAIRVFRILCWVSLVQVLANPTGWIFTSMGKTQTMFLWSLFSTPVLILGIAVGASFGSIESVAWGYLIANGVLFIPLYMIVGRIVDISWRKVIQSTYRELASALVMVGVVSALEWVLPANSNDLLTLAMRTLVGGIIYVMMVISLRSGAYAEVYTILNARLGKYRELTLWNLVAPLSTRRP